MIFGIDFDGTMKRSIHDCEEETAMWRELVATLARYGHEVCIVTARTRPCHRAVTDVERYARSIGIGIDRIIYTGGELKAQYCRAQGIRIDVWIDDMPETIGGSGVILGAQA